MEAKKIKDIMTRNCVSVTEEDNIYQVSLKMKHHNIGFMPVVKNKKIIGVITDRDLVIRGYAEKKSGSEPTTEIMSSHLYTVSMETTVEEAAKLMAEHQIRRLPVVEQDELLGVVAIGDLAVRVKFEDEAGQALSHISAPADPVQA